MRITDQVKPLRSQMNIATNQRFSRCACVWIHFLTLIIAGCCAEHAPTAPHVAVVPFQSRIGRAADSPEARALRGAITRSIRVEVEIATIWPPPSDNGRIMPQTSVRIHDPPCDLAFEVLWPEISTDAFGVIWARKGEESEFQPVRMLVPPAMSAATSPVWATLWPPTNLRTVDVLLRPSPPISHEISPSTRQVVPSAPTRRLDLMHAGMSEAWSEGVIVIEDVPLTWRLKADR